MLYIKLDAGKACRTLTAEEITATCLTGGSAWESVQNRNDWSDYATVERIAAELTQATGKTYLPTDAGECVSPRFDIIEAPVIGSPVSYAFNGDYYPCGHITKISADYRIITATDGASVKRFYRRRQTGAWVYDKTWSMIAGHRSEWNPSF